MTWCDVNGSFQIGSPLMKLSCVHRGEIPDMSKILDRDDFTIMKRAIYATQVRQNVTQFLQHKKPHLKMNQTDV